jgi:SAM-dependent methyltransferase
MDKAIIEVFEKTLNRDFVGAVISNSSDKEKAAKIKIRPVMLKGDLYFQVSEYIGTKIFHSNYQNTELIEKMSDSFEGLFHQVEITSKLGKATILISKKGKTTINMKMQENKHSVQTTIDSDAFGVKDAENLLHNKKKNYILEEGTPIGFLIDLGVMTKDGQIVKAKSDKFKQINRFLEYIEDVLPFLDQERELTILDFGCGKSYLTFAMYYYLKILKGYRISVLGLDLKADVISKCNELTLKYGYDKLRFLVGDIASYEGSSSVDMVVTLHACDTATDYALQKAVEWGAQVILSVPCCQHELSGQMKCDTLKPILKYGIIKERMAALITDALRAELLETKGYRVQLLEFIDMAHTPKNILIRAVKRSTNSQEEVKASGLTECMEFLGVSPCLSQLLREEK